VFPHDGGGSGSINNDMSIYDRNNRTKEKEVGGAMDKASDGELGALRRSVAMAVTVTRNAALPMLEWWC